MKRGGMGEYYPVPRALMKKSMMKKERLAIMNPIIAHLSIFLPVSLFPVADPMAK
jgi:hypothetical protein